MPASKLRIVVATRDVLSPEEISLTLNTVSEMIASSWPEIGNDFEVLIGCTSEVKEAVMIVFVIPRFNMPYDEALVDRMEQALAKSAPVAGRYNPTIIWGNAALS